MKQSPNETMTQSFHRLILVRHGETEGQSSVRYHGRTDVRLSPLGRAQMTRVRNALRSETFAAVYASTLLRTVEAAGIVGRTAERGAAVTQVSGFDEIDFGEWEGLTADEIRARDPDAHARWLSERAEFHYPRGESTTAFRARVLQALRETLHAAPSGDLLLVVHKGVIRSVVTELLAFDDAQRRRLIVDLASIHVIRSTNGRWHPEVLDRTDHL